MGFFFFGGGAYGVRMLRIVMGWFFGSVAVLGAGLEVAVWPEGQTPGKVTLEAESKVERNDGFQRITNVSRPTLTLYPVNKQGGKPSAAMIICPGGGYRYTVIDKEGSLVAEWLNRAGITGLVLKYRSPNNREGALQDLERAVSLTRARAGEWNLDPERIGVMGFSAGGHLAARASTQFDLRTYAASDRIDASSCRPDVAMLVYPAYLEDGEGKVSPELNLAAAIPPTLIIHTEDDTRLVGGSKVYSAALGQNGVQHKFLLYAEGGHGYGLHPQGDARAWPGAALEWLQQIGFVR